MDTFGLDANELATLRQIAELSRSVPPNQRAPISLQEVIGSLQLYAYHPGASTTNQAMFYPGDLASLAAAGLIHTVRKTQYSADIDLTPKGRAFADQLYASVEVPAQRVEQRMREYIEAREFAVAYPAAYERWKAADTLLGSQDAARQLTTIGHMCREAVQFFADALARRFELDVSTDISKTLLRIKAVREHLAIGDSEKEFLEALVVYFGTVSDLIQRQEHGAGKQGDELRLEDARRVVFYSLLVMYEWHRAASRAARSAGAT